MTFWIINPLRLAAMLALVICVSPSVLAQSPTGVQTSALAPQAPFTIGVLRPQQGGLGAYQWANTRSDIILDLLLDMTIEGGSPLLNDVQARLLLGGGAIKINSPKTASRLQVLRLQNLLAMGRHHGLLDLIERTPGGLRDPEITALYVNSLLSTSKTDQACETASGLNHARSAGFWVKLRAFCLARAGQGAMAELTAELLPDQQASDFLGAIMRITAPEQNTKNPDAALQSTPVSTPLQFAMASTIGSKPDLQQASLSLRAGLAGREQVRFLAQSMRAVSEGAVPAKLIVAPLMRHGEKLFADFEQTKQPAVPIPADELTEDNPQVEDTQVDDPQIAMLAHALQLTEMDRLATLYYLAHHGVNPMLRAEALHEIVTPNTDHKSWLANNRLALPVLLELAPSSKLAKFAPAFTRTALLADQVDLARNWLRFTEAEPARDHHLGLAMFALGGKILLQADDLQARIEARQQAKDVIFSSLLIHEALGNHLPAELRHWLSLQNFSNNGHCSDASLAALRASTGAGARGETILRVAQLLGSEGYEALPLHCAAQIIQALYGVGLQKEARLAAMEWLFARRNFQ